MRCNNRHYSVLLPKLAKIATPPDKITRSPLTRLELKPLLMRVNLQLIARSRQKKRITGKQDIRVGRPAFRKSCNKEIMSSVRRIIEDRAVRLLQTRRQSNYSTVPV